MGGVDKGQERKEGKGRGERENIGLVYFFLHFLERERMEICILF